MAAFLAAVLFVKGYRPDLTKKTLQATGILVATSSPDGAQVFLNEHLTTATNDTLNLPPGEYQVKIQKDGFIPWEKKIKIQTGVVTKTEALLFPLAPSFRPLTQTGVLNPSLSPDGTKIVYGVASGSAQRQGVWLLDLTERPLSLQNQSRQISPTLSQAKFLWSPDGKQVLAFWEDSFYLLETDRLNSVPKDVTPTLTLVLTSWENELKTQEKERLNAQKPELFKVISENMKILAWSPEETKILYTASASATLPALINPPVLGANTQPEQREIKAGNIYVYDIKEDKNFFIMEEPKAVQTKEVGPKAKEQLLFEEFLARFSPAKTWQWYPDSRHLIYVEQEKIFILEYDGTNKDAIYAGPFEDNFVFSYPGGAKLIILTTYNKPSSEANLYTINLR